MTRRVYGCPNGHDAGAYAPASALLGGIIALPDGPDGFEMGIIVADTYPFKATNAWADGTAGVSEAVRDSWDFKPADDRLPCCLKCNLTFVRLS